jgi:hypothetical protein
MEKAAGERVASPMPTPMRASASVPKLLATLPQLVIRLQAITPAATKLRRLRRSAARPKGIPKTE